MDHTLILVLLCSSSLWAKPSEYQLDRVSPCQSLRESGSSPGLQCTVDGHFSPVQCADGQCWCVNSEGKELNGTRTKDSAPYCPSRCQLQSLLRCSSSGHFETVQCESSRGQCWCVDADGMEIYGTRQKGRPDHCPGPCEVFSRGLLHSSGPAPPQCADDGSFLPVQCKFLHSTDKSEIDLTTVFSSFPEVFQTFSSFRAKFPDVSSYCFCADSQGREVPHTGLELVLDQVYDSALTGLRSGPAFSQSNIYRILKRRLLGLRLIQTGNFRCPSACESVPGASCEADGSFSSTQCLQGEQCWCVDAEGRELPGTRGSPGSVQCGPRSSCMSQRRSALFRLFSPLSPAHHLTPPSVATPPLCSALLRSLSDLVQAQTDLRDLIEPVVQVLDGLMTSADSALLALTRSSPKRFLENLFGGKFLKAALEGNFTAVGSSGPGLDQIRSKPELIETHRDLVTTLIQVLQDPGVLSALKETLQGAEPKLSLREALAPALTSCSSSVSDLVLSSDFVPRCSSSGGFAPVQCLRDQCWCVEPDGREVEGSRTQGSPARCPSPCERQRNAALRLKGALSAGAEVHIPECSADGHFLPLQCVGGACFCVNEEGGATVDSAPDCQQRVLSTAEAASGPCAEALAEIAAFKQEVMSLVSLSSSSHFPLGLSFLLAKGFHFTTEIGQSEPALLKLLSDNTATATRLAALSVYEQLVAPNKRTFQTFSPQCDADGHFIPTQCDLSTGQCWCVDDGGRFIPGSLTNRRAPKCASRCESARSQTLLSDWLTAQCDQTDGAAAVCVEPGTAPPAGHFTCPQCPVPDISHGALRCGSVTDDAGNQRCDLICFHGYHSALPVQHFLCEVQTNSWTGPRPGSQACQIPQPLQTWSWSQSWSWVQSCAESGSLVPRLLQSVSSRGLCSAQAPVSRARLSLCDESTVELRCDEDSAKLDLTWTLDLSQIQPVDLPDLHTPGEQYSSASKSDYSVGSEPVTRVESGVFLNRTHYVELVRDSLTELKVSQPRLVTVTTPRFGCAAGYGLRADQQVCVLCPPGTFSSLGTCLFCPSGTYQDHEGRSSCITCPQGSSMIGASSTSQCRTQCQRRRGRCSESGDFLPAQPDFLSGIWGCVTKAGAWLNWTNSEKALTDRECTALSNFQIQSESQVLYESSQAQILRTVAAERTSCLKECALDSSCLYVALSSEECELYSSNHDNTECSTPPQTKGFLGNPEAEHFDWLRCSVKVRGGASSRQVFRKTGDRYQSGSKSEYSTSETVTLKRAASGVYRTQVFSANQSTAADVQRFCLSACRRDPCCEGFVLNENIINSGSVMCGFLRSPDVLMCADQDWDVIGQGAANRECGAGLSYNERQGNFLFDLGGQRFTFSADDAALTQKKDGYSSALVSSSSVHLDSEPKSDLSESCPSPDRGPDVDPSVLKAFDPLAVDQVELVPQKQPSLTFWFNKKHYNSQDALHSCLHRCQLESLCSMADMLDHHDGFFFCELFPDTRVCGAYDKSVRRECRPLLHRAPNSTFIKRVDLSGSVKSFYQRVPFKKMVSYSVRTRIQVQENTALPQGFRECERHCDEDHCCRGFGLIREQSSGLVCLPLISLGVQTCPEVSSGWTAQDCGTSDHGPLRSEPGPLGWYMKPVNQWSASPDLCPDFSLDPTLTVNRDQWSLLSGPAHLLIDPALRNYDVIHLSRDIIKERRLAVDWCLRACDEFPSCFAVSVSDFDSGLRCLLYPDTSVCDSASHCQLTIREPAPEAYIRTEKRVQAHSVQVPGSGTLQGQIVNLDLGSDRPSEVVTFLGVPYAQRPIGLLRFLPAQAPDWTGVWEATEPRPFCVEPGQRDGVSEDCLYLNVFTPRMRKGPLPVLVFFHSASSGFLDGSVLASRGRLVVVTAAYRSSVLGFGFSNVGLTDQEAVLQWVSAHIHLMGGAKDQVTVGAERQGADTLSSLLRLPGRPLFRRIVLMGGSVFSPVLFRSKSDRWSQTLDLARGLGCDISDDIIDEDRVMRCLQEAEIQTLNTAQTRILTRTGPMRGWGPVLSQNQDLDHGLHQVDLLLGTTGSDGVIARSLALKDLDDLQGQAEAKTVFYEALVRSLGLDQDRNRTKDQSQDLVKDAASWFYALDHSSAPSSYNLFSRALDNATRDLFVLCPSLKMAEVFAQGNANVYLYHLPATATRSDPHVALDVQLLFGHSRRLSEAEQRLSVAMMIYMSSFVRSGDPNPAQAWSESVLPRWRRVQATEATPTYLELSHAPKNMQGLRLRECSFWNELAPKLKGDLKVKPARVAPPPSTVGQSQHEKDGYS